MVADDAVCVGAEAISISNTIDADSLSIKVVEGVDGGHIQSLQRTEDSYSGRRNCGAQRDTSKGYTWNATAVGIVGKNKLIKGAGIKTGDPIIGIVSPNFRSNGFTLLRAI